MSKFIDLTGQRFGRLTVIKRVENNKYGGARWLCQCICGNEITAARGDLINGDTKSCGCLLSDYGKKLGAKRLIDLTGQKFGRLTVIERNGSDSDGHARWLCKCDCGNETTVTANQLKDGSTKSCGCYQKEMVAKRSTRHGKYKDGKRNRTFVSWYNMLNRCNKENASSYKWYGQRGIKVCKEWYVFDNFLKDMGECPPNMSIDRIDVNGNYTPENCRWATSEEQHNNMRSNVYVEHNGETKTLSQWERFLGMKTGTFKSRYQRGKRGDSLFRKVGS